MREKSVLFLLTVVIVGLLYPAYTLAEEGGAKILFIFDASGSMRQTIEGKTKLKTAKEVLSGLLRDLPAESNVGLEVYGHRVRRDKEEESCNDIEIAVPVKALDARAIKERLDSLDAKGKTPIATSLERGADVLREVEGKRTIVLISDGEETCGGDPLGVAQRIKREFGIDIVIHVIGFDVKDQEKQQLAGIARAGGGVYYFADNADQLKRSLTEIKEKVVKREPPKDIFVEEFDKPTLSEEWKILNENPEGRVLDEGKLLIVTAPGWPGEGATKNMLLYNKEILAKNYEVTAKFSTSVIGAGYDYWAAQFSGIMLYADKDNHLALLTAKCNRCSGWNAKAGLFYKRQGGKASPEIFFGIHGEKNPETYQFKIEKRKFRYTAYYYNPEEGKWQEVGTHLMIGKKLRPGLAAYRYSEAQEVVTEFDSFRIRELE